MGSIADEFDYNLENIQIMTGSPEVSRYEDSVNRDSLAHKSKNLDQIE